MIIDFEHHIYPPEQTTLEKSKSGKVIERHWEGKGKLGIRIFKDASNVDRHLQFMDDAGIGIAVLTPIIRWQWPKCTTPEAGCTVT